MDGYMDGYFAELDSYEDRHEPEALAEFEDWLDSQTTLADDTPEDDMSGEEFA